MRLGRPSSQSGRCGRRGRRWLDELPLPQPYAGKVVSLRMLAGELAREIALLEQVTGDLLGRHDGYQALPGIGPVLPR